MGLQLRCGADATFLACPASTRNAGWEWFFCSDVTPGTLGSIAIRLLHALAVTAPAWHTARESARHRANSDRARQTELEIASIGPFIELMPDEKKYEVREHLTKQYFGRQVDAHEIATPANIAETKNFVFDVVKAAKKG